jgi:hypothetical protein
MRPVISPDPLVDTQVQFRGPDTGLAPIEALEEVAPLLLDEDRFAADAASVSTSRALLFSEIKALTFSLQLACEWDEQTLLARLGCTIDLGKEVPDDDVELDECILFLGLLASLSELVDARPERRALVIEVASLVKQLRCSTRELRTTLDRGEPSGTELMLLGEVDQAAAQTRWYGGRSRQWERTSALSPFAGEAKAHISTGRLDLLIAREDRVLGTNVSKRMRSHVAMCSSCHTALAARTETHPPQGAASR